MYSNNPVIQQELKPAPKVWKWYVVYCIFMTFLYLAVVLIGLAMLSHSKNLSGDEADQVRVQGFVMVFMGGLMFWPFVAAPFLPKRPWAWMYGMVLICLSLSSCCFLPATIPLLIHWNKPENKYYFGRA